MFKRLWKGEPALSTEAREFVCHIRRPDRIASSGFWPSFLPRGALLVGTAMAQVVPAGHVGSLECVPTSPLATAARRTEPAEGSSLYLSIKCNQWLLFLKKISEAFVEWSWIWESTRKIPMSTWSWNFFFPCHYTLQLLCLNENIHQWTRKKNHKIFGSTSVSLNIKSGFKLHQKVSLMEGEKNLLFCHRQ